MGRNGTILKTVDGGNTWVSQTSGILNTLWSVYFIDSLTGWAVGDNGIILHTPNGGKTWETQPSPTTETLYSVYFVDASNGWSVGSGGIVLKYGILSPPIQITEVHLYNSTCPGAGDIKVGEQFKVKAKATEGQIIPKFFTKFR